MGESGTGGNLNSVHHLSPTPNQRPITQSRARYTTIPASADEQAHTCKALRDRETQFRHLIERHKEAEQQFLRSRKTKKTDGTGFGLRQKKSSGLFVAYSGTELAKRTKCPTGQTGVAGAIREFRRKTGDLLLEESNIQCGPRDIIQSGGRGYRLTEKITVVNDNDPVRDPANKPDNPDTDPVFDPDTVSLNNRQAWAMGQIEDGCRLQIDMVIRQFRCHRSTAKRDLASLKAKGLIEFVGAAYKLK